MLDHPIILIIVVVAALLRWLSQKSDAAKPDPERPTVPDQPMPRGGETQTEEERIRRFLEALGQPAGSTPPPKVAPKRETPPHMFPTLPPLTTVPPPLPTSPTPAIQAPPPLPIQRRVFTPAAVQEAGFEVRDLATQTSSDLVPERRRTAAEQQGLFLKLRSTQDLRSAIVLREIFGPPRSLQALETISGGSSLSAVAQRRRMTAGRRQEATRFAIHFRSQLLAAQRVIPKRADAEDRNGDFRIPFWCTPNCLCEIPRRLRKLSMTAWLNVFGHQTSPTASECESMFPHAAHSGDPSPRFGAIRRQGEVGARLRAARQRFTFPSHSRSSVRGQWNAARRRHAGIDHVYAPGQRRGDAQFAIRLCKNGAVADTIFSAVKPIGVLWFELDVASRIIIGGRLRGGQPIGKKFFAHAVRIRIGQQFAGERMHIALHNLRRRPIPARAAIRVQIIRTAVLCPTSSVALAPCSSWVPWPEKDSSLGCSPRRAPQTCRNISLRRDALLRVLFVHQGCRGRRVERSTQNAAATGGE